jgi:hypothetical protein
MRRHRFVLWIALTLTFSGTLALAVEKNLPPWTDDSGLTINAYPHRFSPLRQSANLVARVYHQVDVPVGIKWTMTIRDQQSHLLRVFAGSNEFEPGEPIQLMSVWDGRDEAGAIVGDGVYRIETEIEMRARREAPFLRRNLMDEDNRPLERQSVIRQGFVGFVEVHAFLGPLSVAPHSQTPHDPGVPYNFYFGTLHTQTSYSDGGHPNDATCASSTTHAAGDFDPPQAYNYARNTAHLDYMAVTDHNHFFNDACVGCSAAQVIQRYHTGLNAAAAATVDGSFVAIFGMEWGYIGNSSFPNEGHVNLYETPKLFGWEPSGCTLGSNCYYEVFTDQAGASYPAMYTKALANPSGWGAFGQWNHPSNDAGLDFNQMQYTTDGDDLIHTIAVISGPATDSSTATTDTGYRYSGDNKASYSIYATIDMYNRALGAGYHLAPTADSDVHCSNYGTSTRDRTVILASTLTKASIFDAIHNRRMYATSNVNTQLVYTMLNGASTYYMGAGGVRTSGPVATSGAITLHTSVWDPDGTAVTSIKIKEPVPNNTDGSATVIATGTASPFDTTFTPGAGKHCYYVYVTMATGDELWSSPIWINQGATPDTTPPTTSITAPANGATVSGTTVVTASASDDVGVSRVEFYLDSALAATDTTSPYQWSWDTNTAANGAHTLTSKAYDAANNIGTSAAVSVTVNNVSDFSLSATPASVTVAPGATASYTVTIARSGGFAGVVTFSISGLPAGATGTFNPNPSSTNSSALTVTTSTTTPAGSYPLTITGVGGSLTHTASVTLVVQAGNFTLAITPTSRTVQSNGGSTTYTVNVTRTSFTSSISFSVTGLPTGATGSFSPNPATANSTTLTVTVPASSPAGTYTLTVTGTAGGLSRTATTTLVKSTSCNGNC